jgi:hypothetical protein
MSHYLAAALAILLLAGVTLLGLDGYGALHRLWSVEAALGAAESRLALDGGLSPAVRRLIEERITEGGGQVDRLTIEGSSAGASFGTPLTLAVVYRQPVGLDLPLLGGTRGEVVIRRSVTVASGWRGGA